MSDITPNMRKYSSQVVDGVEAAPGRAMLRAVGFTDEDFKKPVVGIASLWSMVTPCNMHIDQLARDAEAGANAAGGKAVIFGTITVSDGISMGTPGMRYSLVSREVIADSIALQERTRAWRDRLEAFERALKALAAMPGVVRRTKGRARLRDALGLQILLALPRCAECALLARRGCRPDRGRPLDGRPHVDLLSLAHTRRVLERHLAIGIRAFVDGPGRGQKAQHQGAGGTAYRFHGIVLGGWMPHATAPRTTGSEPPWWHRGLDRHQQGVPQGWGQPLQFQEGIGIDACP